MCFSNHNLKTIIEDGLEFILSISIVDRDNFLVECTLEDHYVRTSGNNSYNCSIDLFNVVICYLSNIQFFKYL
jgi:hypothetical protein